MWVFSGTLAPPRNIKLGSLVTLYLHWGGWLLVSMCPWNELETCTGVSVMDWRLVQASHSGCWVCNNKWTMFKSQYSTIKPVENLWTFCAAVEQNNDVFLSFKLNIVCFSLDHVWADYIWSILLQESGDLRDTFSTEPCSDELPQPVRHTFSLLQHWRSDGDQWTVGQGLLRLNHHNMICWFTSLNNNLLFSGSWWILSAA